MLDFSPLTMHSSELGAAFSFMTPREVWTMRVCAWSLPENPQIVNIGAGAGTSGLALRESRKDAKIWTIDICPGGPLGGMENERNAFANLQLELPIQILGDSKVVGASWRNGPLDLLFVDGDHSYEGCLGDIYAWRDHVKPGGLILFHDYRRAEWVEVARAVEQSGAMADFEHLLTVDTLWIGRRK